MNYEDRDQYGIYKSRAKGITTSAGENSPAPAFMGAETLIGSDVYNHKSENIGSIKEIMLNLHDGKVAYAVLSFGGFLGMGEKLFAVPWVSLTLDAKNRYFVLNVEKEYLKDAPGFDKNDWPNMADKTWSDQVHAYYCR
jgi:sporulation protein YlmC with PRC-barrel domain